MQKKNEKKVNNGIFSRKKIHGKAYQINYFFREQHGFSGGYDRGETAFPAT